MSWYLNFTNHRQQMKDEYKNSQNSGMTETEFLISKNAATPEEIREDEIRKAFIKFDSDQNGTLERMEIETMLAYTEQMWLSQRDLDDLMEEMGQPKNGSVTVDAFIKWDINRGINAHKRDFANMDLDKSGFIDYEKEFIPYLVWQGVPEEKIPSMFKHDDADGDGKLSLQEYLFSMQVSITPADRRAMQIRKVFKEIDQSGDGLLDEVEFDSFVRQFNLYGNKAVQELIANMKRTGEQISYEQFIAADLIPKE